jgi:para-aminobenzoate synthetase/4-amino-4-deoxychorismate lyase
MAMPGDYFLDLASLVPGDAVLRHEDPEQGPGWLHFTKPIQILATGDPAEVERCVEAAGDHVGEGGWAAGFLSYEAGAALHPEMPGRESCWPVLAWFGLYDEAPRHYRELLPEYEPIEARELVADWGPGTYESAFAQVKQALSEGETYQVNLTFRERFRLEHEATRFFASRCGVDPPKYAAFIHGGDWQVASFSPELLFERKGEDIVTRPMKGTALVPKEKGEIAEVADRLSRDPKSIAENIMIVDMVRNDLGAVCEVGSVTTPQLLHVERHRGLLQMTSTVVGRSKAATSKLLKSLFPAASITGAPKVATTHIIRRLEAAPRHIYCGSIGVMAPGWQRFNVAIRTALIEEGNGEFGVGSGIVWDSVAEAEYQECLDKRELLLRPADQWRLVEALGAHHLDDPQRVERHLQRLAGQAERLGIPLRLREMREAVGRVERANPEERVKVRISVRADGEFEIGRASSAVKGGAIRAVLASHPVSSQDANLRIKTNSRAVLDEHLEEHPEADEVLLYNERGHLTEFCRGNVLMEIDGRLLTPRPESGCLPGITVAAMVERGEAAFADLEIGLIPQARQILFANSVTGLVRVEI